MRTRKEPRFPSEAQKAEKSTNFDDSLRRNDQAKLQKQAGLGFGVKGFGVISQNRGTLSIPPSTRILIIGTAKRGTPVFGNPQMFPACMAKRNEHNQPRPPPPPPPKRKVLNSTSLPRQNTWLVLRVPFKRDSKTQTLQILSPPSPPPPPKP